MERTDPDLLVAKSVRRKCESIVKQTYKAFYGIIAEYGTLSVDEILAIGLGLFMRVTVEPLEKLSTDPDAMRQELIDQLTYLVQRGEQELN